MLEQRKWIGWKSGKDIPVMELGLSEKDLATRYGLNFDRFEDDQLGAFSATHFTDAIIGPVVITLYDRSPTHTATVSIDSQENIAIAIRRLIGIMELKQSDIVGAVREDRNRHRSSRGVGETLFEGLKSAYETLPSIRHKIGL